MAPTSHFPTSTSTSPTLTRRSLGLNDPISQVLVGISVAAILISILILLLIGRNKRTNAVLSEELRCRPYDKDMSTEGLVNTERAAVPLLEEPPLTPGMYPPPVASPRGRERVEAEGEERASYWVLSSRAGSRSPSPMGPRRV